MWIKYNPNPSGRHVGDCTVRAITKALGLTWEQAYAKIAVQGFASADMPSSNAVWGAFLRRSGWTRHIIPNTCPDCYTVADFCADHPEGTYILACSGHVVTVQDGNAFDAWDSTAETPIFYWTQNGKDDE